MVFGFYFMLHYWALLIPVGNNFQEVVESQSYMQRHIFIYSSLTNISDALQQRSSRNSALKPLLYWTRLAQANERSVQLNHGAFTRMLCAHRDVQYTLKTMILTTSRKPKRQVAPPNRQSFTFSFNFDAQIHSKVFKLV